MLKNIFKKKEEEVVDVIQKNVERREKKTSKTFFEDNRANNDRTFSDFFVKWRYITFNTFFSHTANRHKKNVIAASLYIGIIALVAFSNLIILASPMTSELRTDSGFYNFYYSLITLFLFDWIFRSSFGDLYSYKGVFKTQNKKLKFLYYQLNFLNLIDFTTWLVPLILVSLFDAQDPTSILIPILLMGKSFSAFRFIYIFNKAESVRTFLVIAQRSAKLLLVIIFSMLFLVFIFALFIYNFEIFDENIYGDLRITNFFDSFWLCFITVTTIGYGDVVPTTNSGRILVMVLALIGIGFYSFLTSIIVNAFTRYLDELRRKRELKNIETSKKILDDYKDEIDKKIQTLTQLEESVNLQVNEINNSSSDAGKGSARNQKEKSKKNNLFNLKNAKQQSPDESDQKKQNKLKVKNQSVKNQKENKKSEKVKIKEEKKNNKNKTTTETKDQQKSKKLAVLSKKNKK